MSTVDDDNNEELEMEEEEVHEEVVESNDGEYNENEREHHDDADEDIEDKEQDDEDEDDDDIENDNDEPWSGKKIKRLCARLQMDDPSITKVYVTEGFEFASQLGPAMIGNTQLRELRLSYVRLNEQDATYLAKGISQSNLERIQIEDDCTESAVARKRLYQGISQSTTIQEISLNDVKVEVLDGLGEVVLALKHLEQFEVEGLYGFLDPRLSQMAYDAFMSTITHLRLCNFELGDFAMAAQGFHNNTTLKILELSGCDVDDGHIRLLVEQWHSRSPLERLILAGNEIGPAGAQLLFRAAAAHSSLLFIDLSNNEGIGLKGLKIIGQELSTQLHLEVVSIQHCANVIHYDDETCPEAQLQAEAIQQARCALMNGMRINQSIIHFILFDDRLISWTVHFYTAINQFGRRLLLSSGQKLALPIWCHVLAKCQQQPIDATNYMYPFWGKQPLCQQQPNYATSFMYYFLCEQPHLVHCDG
jgi:hypothetical protein